MRSPDEPRTAPRYGPAPDLELDTTPAVDPLVNKEFEMLKSYLRSMVVALMGACVAIGHLPTSKADFLILANALWIAILPLGQRWLDPKDAAFGMGSKPK